MTPEWHADENDLLKEFNDPNTPWARKVNILYTLAYQASSKNDHDTELVYLESAREICIEHNLVSEGIDIRITMGKVLVNHFERNQAALDIANEAEALLPQFSLDSDELLSKASVAQIKNKALMGLERFDEAFYQAKTYAEIAVQLGNEPSMAYGYEMAAECLVEIEDYTEAIKYANLAKGIYFENERPTDVCDCDRILAKAMIGQGLYAQAVKLLREVRSAEQLLKQRSNLSTKVYLAIAYAKSGDVDRAQRLFKRLMKDAFSSWDTNYKLGLIAAAAYADMLNAQGDTQGAKVLLDQVQAVKNRLPSPDHSKDQARIQEVDEHIKKKQPKLGLMVAGEFMVEKSEQGDISGYWKGIFATMRCHRELNDAEAIATLWDSISHAALEFQDDIVIQIKNIASHALYVMDRVEEAFQINEEVLNDYRLKHNLQEKAYAHENKARFLKSQKKRSSKWIDLAIEENLEAGNIERALKLSKFRRGGNDKGNPESYK